MALFKEYGSRKFEVWRQYFSVDAKAVDEIGQRETWRHRSRMHKWFCAYAEKKSAISVQRMLRTMSKIYLPDAKSIKKWIKRSLRKEIHWKEPEVFDVQFGLPVAHPEDN